MTLNNTSKTWEFYFEDKENLHVWLIHLIQHAADHRRWKQVAEEKMEVFSPKAEEIVKRSVKRTKSKLVLLYNETG